MIYSDSIVAARTALTTFTGSAGFAALPATTRDLVYAAIAYPSPVVTAVNGMEALYGARADLDADGRQACADCANQVANGSFFDKGARAAQIIAVIRADAGEITLDPDAVVPDPDPQFTPAT